MGGALKMAGEVGLGCLWLALFAISRAAYYVCKAIDWTLSEVARAIETIEEW